MDWRKHKKTTSQESGRSMYDQDPTYWITVAIMNMVAKKPKDTIKPTPESIRSLRLDWTSFSNVFISHSLLFLTKYKGLFQKNPYGS